MTDRRYRLTDDEVITFLIQGYHLIHPDFRPGLNADVCRQFDQNGLVAVDLENDPHFELIFTKAPALREVFAHPAVEGALTSLLGEQRLIYCWYCHATPPGSGEAGWHQDDINIRHHQVRRLVVMYYPQDVTPDMGPTYIVPSTHFWNTPTDRMATYGNFRNQVAMTVPAGTLALTHYDLWHSASHNASDKTRYMIKAYIDRLEEPTAPNWNHDPARGDRVARHRLHHECPNLASGSEYYKERHLRWHAWQHLKGEIPAQPYDLVRIPGSPEIVSLDRIQGFIGDPRL